MDFIYILLKAVVFIVQQIHEMMREILNNLSPSSATSSLFVIGDDVVLKVWWYHLNMGPLRNFALSCPDIQIGSERRGAHTGHRGEEGQWRFGDPTAVPCSAPSWPRCRHRLRLRCGGAQRHHFSFLPCTPPSPAPMPCAPVAGLCQHQPGFVAIKHDSMHWKNTRCSSGIAPRICKAPVKWVLFFFCFIIFVWACCSHRVGNKY